MVSVSYPAVVALFEGLGVDPSTVVRDDIDEHGYNVILVKDNGGLLLDAEGRILKQFVQWDSEETAQRFAIAAKQDNYFQEEKEENE